MNMHTKHMAASASAAAAAAVDEVCVEYPGAAVEYPGASATRKRTEPDETAEPAVGIPMELFCRQLLGTASPAFQRVAYMGTDDMRIAVLRHVLPRAQQKYDCFYRCKIGQVLLWTPTALAALPDYREVRFTGEGYGYDSLLAFAVSENDHVAMTTRAQEMVALNYATKNHRGDGLNIWYCNILYLRLREDGYMEGDDRVWPDPPTDDFQHQYHAARQRKSRLYETVLADAPRALERLIGVDTDIDNVVYRDGTLLLLYQKDTLAHMAARYRRPRVFAWLQERGASMDAENVLGETPHDIAAHTGLCGRVTKAARVDGGKDADA